MHCSIIWSITQYQNNFLQYTLCFLFVAPLVGCRGCGWRWRLRNFICRSKMYFHDRIFTAACLFTSSLIPCESIKTQHFLIVCCLQNRAWIWANVTWLGRVIFSNYFDTTYDEYYKWRNRSRYCVRRKNTLCQLLHGESMRDSVKETNDTKFWQVMVSLGVFVCCLFIHGKMIHKMISKYSERFPLPHHIIYIDIYPLILKQWTIEKCCVLIDSLCIFVN